MCCGGCKKNIGNYTYIRYATDENGSNFSKQRYSNNLSRCYQAIITSEVKLNESSQSFEGLFNGLWVDICRSSSNCEWYDYKVPTDEENFWNFSGPTPIFSQDPTINNGFSIKNKWFGDVVVISGFKDLDGNELQSGVEYCFEFNLVKKAGGGGYYESLFIGFGDGSTATEIQLAGLDVGINKIKIKAASGTNFDASDLIIRVGGPSLAGEYKIVDFHLANGDCCNTCEDCIPEPPDDGKTYLRKHGEWVEANFIMLED